MDKTKVASSIFVGVSALVIASFSLKVASSALAKGLAEITYALTKSVDA